MVNSRNPAESASSLLSSRPLIINLNIALVGLWLWLYGPLLPYLSIIFSREDFRTNQLLLLGVLGLIMTRLTRVRRERLRLHFDVLPRWNGVALVLLGGSSIAYLLAARFLDINTLSTSLWVLSGYGLLGLWLNPQSWRQGLPATFLLIGVLPFGDHLQTFVGYPMRISTAAIIQNSLTVIGIDSVGIDTILVLENGVSQIDLPCSGVKSLWTGWLFLIAATWIERRRVNGRWLGLAVIMAALLFVANLSRVAILVLVGQVEGWLLLAEMLHVPLGVLGFAAVCAFTLILLRRQPRHAVSQKENNPTRPTWLLPGLVGLLLIFVLLYTPRPQTGLDQPAPGWHFSPNLTTEPLPLKPDEFAWLARDGAASADRRRFEWHSLSGTMILITSHTWRAHHRPERCFEVYGLNVDDSRTHLVTPTFPIRSVTLSRRGSPSDYTAAYWFQSANSATDDYASRIWADMSPERARWVLVSIVFDARPPAAEVETFYLALHKAVAQSLQGGNPQ